MIVLGEMFPREDVAIRKLAFIARPRSDLDLKGCVVAVKPKEIIDGGLSVAF